MQVKFDTRELTRFAKNLKKQSLFATHMKALTKEIAKALLELMYNKTPVKTGNLKSEWKDKGNTSFKVKKVPGGYQVTLRNKAKTKLGFPYALSVNDGHYSHNQFGGPYEVRNRHVKFYDGNADDTFVYGHFFVEKSIVEIQKGKKLETIIMREIEKWFTEVVGG